MSRPREISKLFTSSTNVATDSELNTAINTASTAAVVSANNYTDGTKSELIPLIQSASATSNSYTNSQINALTTTDIEEGNNLYFTDQRSINSGSATYLTLTNASSTYLTQANATSTYLTQTNATNTYLTQNNASATYLTRSNASATYSTIASPTFTGTSAFSNVQITGILDLQELRETVVNSSIISNILTANFLNGSIFYLASAPGANFTLNLTNLPLIDLKTQTVSVVTTQGATGYIPNVFQLDGVGQTIRWIGGSAPSPTNSAGKIDIFNFTIFRTASSTIVIGNSNLNI